MQTSCLVRIAVPIGTVTLYSLRVWHRGSKQLSNRDRTFCFLDVKEDGMPAPPLHMHTMPLAEIGMWFIDKGGLKRRGDQRS